MSLQIETLSTAALTPYARNARTHSPEQVRQIAASITEFGFTNPVLIDLDGGIIAGHGRVMAAQSLGLEQVPCLRLAYLTDAQKRAYILADNQLAMNAGWDESLLSLELTELQGLDVDLALIGFDPTELDRLLEISNPPPPDDGSADEIPDLQPDAITQPGDVWLLGKHRIMCRDSTISAMVQKLLGGGLPHLMVTDPPYGVEYDPSRTSDNPLKSGKVLNDDRADWREAWALFPGDVAYVWHASLFTHTVLRSLEDCGFEHRSLIVWGKDRFTLGRGHYHWQHEPAWYVVRKGAKGHWNGDRTQSTLWSIKAREDSGHGHGTQKPVECMRRPIENNSVKGDAVYEPFSGSGTTLIACEQTGRRCYAMELSPHYVDVAVRRWQQLTGQRARLESTGQQFPEA